jgi:hypothetical protein
MRIVAQTSVQAVKQKQLKNAGADNGLNDLHFLDSNAVHMGKPTLKV